MPSEDTQFKVGNPGGPGRPKGSLSIKDSMRRKLRELVPGDKNGRAYLDALAEITLAKALTGGHADRRLALEYLEGKPTATVNVNMRDYSELSIEELEEEERRLDEAEAEVDARIDAFLAGAAAAAGAQGGQAGDQAKPSGTQAAKGQAAKGRGK